MRTQTRVTPFRSRTLKPATNGSNSIKINFRKAGALDLFRTQDPEEKQIDVKPANEQGEREERDFLALNSTRRVFSAEMKETDLNVTNVSSSPRERCVSNQSETGLSVIKETGAR
jgi:hypothetical protein